jgi:hypothetical protein
MKRNLIRIQVLKLVLHRKKAKRKAKRKRRSQETNQVS